MLLDIFEEHLDEAEFLFVRRQRAFEMLDLQAEDLTEFDARLRSHLDGLLLDGDAAWRLCAPLLAEGTSEQAFVASIIAFEAGDDSRRAELEQALAELSPEVLAGVASAAVHTRWDGVEAWLRTLLERPEPTVRALALRALGERAVDPGEALDRAVAGEEHDELIAALHAAFRCEVPRTGNAVLRCTASDDPEVLVAALPVAARYAPNQARTRCLELLEKDHEVSPTAVDVLGALGNLEDFARICDVVTNGDGRVRRQAMLALGYLGDSRAVPVLAAMLQSPETAGVATAALQLMLGDRWATSSLEHNEEDEGAWTPDDDLECVDHAVFDRWWSAHAPSHPPHIRFRHGTSPAPGSGALPLPLLWLERIRSQDS